MKLVNKFVFAAFRIERKSRLIYLARS